MGWWEQVIKRSSLVHYERLYQHTRELISARKTSQRYSKKDSIRVAYGNSYLAQKTNKQTKRCPPPSPPPPVQAHSATPACTEIIQNQFLFETGHSPLISKLAHDNKHTNYTDLNVSFRVNCHKSEIERGPERSCRINTQGSQLTPSCVDSARALWASFCC